MPYPAALKPPTLAVITTTDPVAGLLPTLLGRLSALAMTRGEIIEVVIVDDLKQWPAPDLTILPDFTGLHIKTLWYPERRGQLSAMLAGVAQTRCPMIYTTDPDMFACVSELPEMLDQLDDNTILLHGVRSRRADVGLVRRIGSHLANVIVSTLTGIQTADLGSPIALLQAARIQPILDEGAEAANPRLYLYARLGNAARSYPLENGAQKGVPSQYRLFTLVALFFRLIRQSIEIRQKLNAAASTTHQ